MVRPRAQRCRDCGRRFPVAEFQASGGGRLRVRCRRCFAIEAAGHVRCRDSDRGLPRHICRNPACCGGPWSSSAWEGVRDLGLMLWGLGARNAALARAGLPQVGVLAVNGTAVVYLSRNRPPRTFPSVGAARAWAHRRGVRLVAARVPD